MVEQNLTYTSYVTSIFHQVRNRILTSLLLEVLVVSITNFPHTITILKKLIFKQFFYILALLPICTHVNTHARY